MRSSNFKAFLDAWEFVFYWDHLHPEQMVISKVLLYGHCGQFAHKGHFISTWFVRRNITEDKHSAANCRTLQVPWKWPSVLRRLASVGGWEACHSREFRGSHHLTLAERFVRVINLTFTSRFSMTDCDIYFWTTTTVIKVVHLNTHNAERFFHRNESAWGVQTHKIGCYFSKKESQKRLGSSVFRLLLLFRRLHLSSQGFEGADAALSNRFWLVFTFPTSLSLGFFGDRLTAVIFSMLRCSPCSWINWTI